MREVLLALAAMLAVIRPVFAQAEAWTRLDMDGKRPVSMAVMENGAIRIEGDSAVSFFYRPLHGAKTSQDLSWRWRVDTMPPATSLSIKGQDDRPLAVHVIFPAPAGEGMFDTLARSLRSMMAGSLFHGRMITYVFGGAHDPGTRLRNPYLPKDATIIVLRDHKTPLGQWFDERVNPAADYVRAFGAAPPLPALLSVSSDTDDRGGIVRASIQFPE